MAKIKKSKLLSVNGYSLLEVIVSTIIILIAFLLFSVLLSQLMSSRRIVPETKLLLKVTSFQKENGNIDSSEVKTTFDQADVINTTEIINSFPFQHHLIKDKSSGKLILQFFSVPDSENFQLLFQQ